MPFYLCGYIVNARQWKNSKEKRKKHLKAKKALGKLNLLALGFVYQLNSAGSSGTTGFSIKATAGCCL